MRIRRLYLSFLLVTCLLTAFCGAFAQDSALLSIDKKLQEKYLTTVNSKASKFNDEIDKYTSKTLRKIIKEEEKIKKKVARIDSSAAKKIFSYAVDSLKKMEAAIKGKTGKLSKYFKSGYFPYLDTLKQSLSLYKNAKGVVDKAGHIKNEVQNSLNVVDGVEDRLAEAENIGYFLQERISVLQTQLAAFPTIGNNLKNISKQAYYYKEKITTYKNIFSDPSTIETQALALIRKLPAFQKLMQENSQLAGLFASPGGFPGISGSGSSIPVVNGLANRAALQQFMQTNIPSAGTNPSILNMQQQLPDMSGQVNTLKNKLNELGGMGDKKIKDFSPNTQHSKSIAKRMEWGTDFQFGKSINYIPATASIALKAGYKLNNKSSVGIGVNYILGLGNGWRDIHFSNEGIGFRTYVKWKLKKGFDIQGGSEWNHMIRFSSIEHLRGSLAWKQSALLGLSKSYAVGKKMKGNVQILYDFLYKKTIPITQPVLFRFGYGL